MSKKLTKQELKALQAVHYCEEAFQRAEVARRTERPYDMGDYELGDLVITNEDSYRFYSVLLKHKDIFKDIYTANEWMVIESAVSLYGYTGKQTIVVGNEEYEVVDSIANDDLIKELSKKLGKRGK